MIRKIFWTIVQGYCYLFADKVVAVAGLSLRIARKAERWKVKTLEDDK